MDIVALLRIFRKKSKILYSKQSYENKENTLLTFTAR